MEMVNNTTLTKTKSFLRPILILSLGTLFYVYGFTLRIMPSAMTQELMADFGIKAQMLGVLVGLMYWGYTLMQIPSGLLFDRFNSRYLLTTTVLVCTFGTFLLGYTDNIVLGCIGSFVMGLGEAFGFVGVLVLASRWFAAKYFAFIVGIVQLMGSVGAIIGEGPIAALVNHFGRKNTILYVALFGILLAISIFMFVRDNPNYVNLNNKAESKKSEWQRLKLVTHKPQNWWVALYSFCIWAPVLIMAGLWVVPFLMVLYNTTNTIAASAASWIWIGIGVGSPLFGWWSDRIGRRCFPLSISALLSLIPSFFIIYGHPSWLVMDILLFIFGVGASGQALSFGLVQDNNPPTVGGTAVGLNNMAVVFGGVLLQPLVGFLLHLNWDQKFQDGVPIYSLQAYRHALVSVPICAALAFIISAFIIKETHCKPQYKVPYTD